MSALPPKADIGTHSRDVCFVPKADIGSQVASTFLMSGIAVPRRRNHPNMLRWPSAAVEPVHCFTIIHSVVANVAWWIS
jgi:hypothetical protein